MRIATFAFFCGTLAIAQTPNPDFGSLAGKPVEVDFGKMLNAINTKVHIHTVPYSCKGKPDHAYAMQGSVTYACINHKDVCSEEKGVTIPYRLIEKLETAERDHAVRMAETREKVNHGLLNAQAGKLARNSALPSLIPAVTISHVTAAELAPRKVHGPLTDEQLDSVPVGITRDEVLQKLGEPLMKISGDSESFLYALASGDSVQLELNGGRLASVQVIRR